MDLEARALHRRLPALVPDGTRAVLVVVVETRGSAPRDAGASLLVFDDGRFEGTIGGGHVEEAAIADARAVFDAGVVKRELHYKLGPQMAQCCGGEMTLAFELLDAASAARLARVEPADEPTLLLFGAGHVAAATARVAAVLPWRIIVVDARAEWCNERRFARPVECVCTPPLVLLASWGVLGPDAAASDLVSTLVGALVARPDPTATHAVIMTHDHALDREIAAVLLASTVPFAYVGLIGSKTKAAVARQRLRDRGFPEDVVARLDSPIGLRVDGRSLGGKLPGEIAVSAVADLMRRRGRP